MMRRLIEEDDESILGTLAALKIDDDAATPSILPKIQSLGDLDRHLPNFVEWIYESIGSQHLESIYQHCLGEDLKEAGVKVDLEVPFPVEYKRKIVGTRRIDMVIKTAQNEIAIIEIKSVTALNPIHANQLKYYMAATKVATGYLINFPGTTGKFPDLPLSHEFSTNVLSGTDNLSTVFEPTLGIIRNEDESTHCKIQIVKVKWSFDPDPIRLAIRERRLKAKTEQELSKPAITKNGTVCKICMRVGRLNCMHHSPSNS